MNVCVGFFLLNDVMSSETLMINCIFPNFIIEIRPVSVPIFLYFFYIYNK